MPNKFEPEKFIDHTKQFDEHNVGEEMARNSSFAAYYGTQARNWDRMVANVKTSIRIREAQVASNARAELGKATEGVVNSKIALDDEWQSLQSKLSVATEQADLYDIAFRTLMDRSNNLRSFGARARAEMEKTVNNSYSVDTTPSARSQEVTDVLRRVAKGS